MGMVLVSYHSLTGWSQVSSPLQPEAPVAAGFGSLPAPAQGLSPEMGTHRVLSFPSSTARLRWPLSPSHSVCLSPRMWWPTLLVLFVPMVVAQLQPEQALDIQWDLWKKTYRKQYNGEVRQSPTGGDWTLEVTGATWGMM